MSQIAVFTFTKASDVPHFGFWSKPKPRLFRRAECKFDEFLKERAKRQESFTGGDGVYVALVFAWIEAQDKSFSEEADPVIETVRKNVSGSHWLPKFPDQRLRLLIEKPMAETEWIPFLSSLGIEEIEGYRLNLFNEARRFVHEKFSELKEDEALLVSVG